MFRLSGRNGDVYEGEFANHKYHGLGLFTKKNGDKYVRCVYLFISSVNVLALIMSVTHFVQSYLVRKSYIKIFIIAGVLRHIYT